MSNHFETATSIPIKELLIEATFAPNRALRKGVYRIDLGELGKEAERLYDKAESGPKIEYCSPALVTADRKLLLHKEGISGTNEQVRIQLQVQIRKNAGLLPKYLRQNRFIGALIHNHPEFELGPSPTDMQSLFLEDTYKEAQTAVFVATPNTKIILFRGDLTPQWTKEFATEKERLWYRLTRERLSQFNSPYTLFVENADLQRRVRNALLRKIASTYDLQVFMCPLRENVAFRASF